MKSFLFDENSLFHLIPLPFLFLLNSIRKFWLINIKLFKIQRQAKRDEGFSLRGIKVVVGNVKCDDKKSKRKSWDGKERDFKDNQKNA